MSEVSLVTRARQVLSELLYPEGLEQRDQADRIANTDALTCVANRRALDLALPSAERDPHTMIIVFDLNNFKAANDLRGHAAGDHLLRELAAALCCVAIAHQLGERVFRYGGDEFVILAPPSVAAVVRDEVEALFGTHDIASRGAGARGAVVVTARVTVSGAHGQTFAEADARLRERKARRKARARCREIGARA